MLNAMNLQRILIGFFLLVASSPAWAATGTTPSPQSLGSFGHWQTFVSRENSQPVCYMTLTLMVPPVPPLRRRIAHLTITHRPADNSKDVISYDSGFAFRTESTVAVATDKDKFDLFTTQNTAWARDATTDRKIAEALRRSSRVTLTSYPATKPKKGPEKPVIDKMDLTGAAKAYQAISKACGYADAEPAQASKPEAKTKAKEPTKTKAKSK